MTEAEQILVEIHNRRLEETRLFDNFEKYYGKRDFVKASEFLWGSVTKIAYAIGLLYGKKVGKHKEIVALMKDLARGDPKIVEWINSAESLHSNFYHNWMEEEIFEDYVKKVINLRMWLVRMLDERMEEMRRTSL